MIVFQIESAIETLLLLVTVGMVLFALVDAVTRPAEAFTATDKLTKPGWLAILAISLIATLLFRSPIGILGLLSVVAAGVYLADVRPALIDITRRR